MFFWMFHHVSKFVGFQTMVILDPYGMTFDAVSVFGLAFHLLFKSVSTYCGQDLFFLNVPQWGGLIQGPLYK